MYSDLTDPELDAKIAELVGKIEAVEGGGAVVRVAGGGRVAEYTRANARGLRNLLIEAKAEKSRRAGTGGRAIPVVAR